jgi:L-cysteine desulfidase
MTPREYEIIELVHKEVKPALGCTEPIAVALASAKASEILKDEIPAASDYELDVEVSGNILKNGMGVGIPGTGMVGLYIATALGAICGKSKYGLEVLKGLTGKDVEKAKEMVDSGKVKIRVADNQILLYVKVTIKSGSHKAWAIIEDDHDRIVETGLDNTRMDYRNGSDGKPAHAKTTLDYNLTVKEIVSFAQNAAFEDISFILADRDLNLALAREGLSGDYGLNVGKAILENQHEVFGEDFISYAMGMTAAASDARMAGCKLPAMSNSGSGNQGITVSMPVIAYSLKYDVDDEKLARALILSNLIAIHIKGYLGKLSALCGCVIASTGSACGIVFLRGGNYGQICAAIKNMIGNITGMVCDGAKVGCAMKVASGVACAVQSCVLALRGTCIKETDGIIDRDIENTIKNLGKIGSLGMKSTDHLIQQIMLRKQ